MAKRLFAVGAVVALLASPWRIWPQLVVGQYEDEAPLRSWNTLGLALAPSLACGGAGAATAWDASAVLVNPALAASLPRFTATVSGTHLSASMLRYSLLNTGVLSTTGPVTDRSYGIDFAGAAFRFGNWTLAGSVSLLEGYGRPGLEYTAEQGGARLYAIRVLHSGLLRGFSLSAARALGSRLAVGLGITVLRGESERSVEEEFAADGVRIDDLRSQRYSGLAWSAGLTYALTGRLSAGLAVRAPFAKEISGERLLEYRVPAAGTDIRISTDGDDRVDQPWAAAAGLSWRPGGAFLVAADVRYFCWSGYEASVFGEPRERNFRDVVTASLGVEYAGAYRVFGRMVRSPLRLGLGYDPQPMRDPRSAYLYLTFGTGLHVGRFRMDVGAALGKEHGSGDGLSARRVAVSLGYDLGEDRP